MNLKNLTGSLRALTNELYERRLTADELQVAVYNLATHVEYLFNSVDDLRDKTQQPYTPECGE